VDGKQVHTGIDAGLQLTQKQWLLSGQLQWLHARISDTTLDPTLNATQPINVPAITLRALAQYSWHEIPGLRTSLRVSHEGQRRVLENGSISFAVLFSPIPILKDVDYDTNNDGVLDLPNGALLQDAVGWTNGELTALIYGGVILTQSAGTPDAAVRFADNTTPFSLQAWYNGDLITATTFDPLEVSSNMPDGAGITPGNINIPNNGTGIDALNISSLNVYPNPSQGLINIDNINPNEVSNMLVYSIDGRLIRHFEVADSFVNLGTLETGIYWIELRTNRDVTRAQIVISY
jgi:hypothetical protein